MFDGEMARLNLGKRQVELTVGRWSPIVELEFSMGWPFRFRALTRFLLSQVEQGVRLYALPTQIHPLSTPWRYATPRGQVRALWGSCGPFLTLGMPQDTTGLEDGCLNNAAVV